MRYLLITLALLIISVPCNAEENKLVKNMKSLVKACNLMCVKGMPDRVLSLVCLEGCIKEIGASIPRACVQAPELCREDK